MAPARRQRAMAADAATEVAAVIAGGILKVARSLGIGTGTVQRI